MIEKQPINWSSTIQQTSEQLQALRSGNGTNVIDNKRIRMVSITGIFPDSNQPRKNIDPNSQDIKDLAESIKQHGFINFITVRSKDGGYIIVSGERRFVAAKVAGLEKIPVMVLANEMEPMQYSMIQLEENLQRKDLTPLEEAEAYERLHREFGIKQVDIAEMVRKSKGYVSQMLRVARIHQTIKEDIRQTNNAVTKEVLWLLSAYPEPEQLKLWEQIKSRPTESALKAVTKESKFKQEKRVLKSEEVLAALQKVIEIKGRDCIFYYISEGKAKKLMKEAEKVVRTLS